MNNNTAKTKDVILNEAMSGDGVKLTDFVAYLPKHTFIFTPTGDHWRASSVDAALPKVVLLENGAPVLTGRGKLKMIKATEWLARNRAVLSLPARRRQGR